MKIPKVGDKIYVLYDRYTLERNRFTFNYRLYIPWYKRQDNEKHINMIKQQKNMNFTIKGKLFTILEKERVVKTRGYVKKREYVFTIDLLEHEKDKYVLLMGEKSFELRNRCMFINESSVKIINNKQGELFVEVEKELKEIRKEESKEIRQNEMRQNIK